ncbi:MAG: GxxExxY protein [Cyclobacteriaceae bacterium]
MSIQDELTYKVIGCAMEVHKTLGNRFQEVIYAFQVGLLINFGSSSMEYKRIYRSNKSSKSLNPGYLDADN